MSVDSITARIVDSIRRIRIRRIYIVSLAVLVGVYLLFGWLALPAILQSQAERYVRERSGHHLTMDRPSFNPFLLSLRMKNLRLTEPDGRPLLAFKELLIDFSSTSLFRRAYVFDEISLTGLDASVVVLPKNRLNWSAFIEAFQSKEPEKSSELTRLIIRKFSLSQGRLYLADRRSGNERATRLAPLNLELTDLSTLPNGKGQYELTATTGFGAKIAWDGVVALKPIAISGHFHIGNVVLPRLAAYVPLPDQIAAPQGVASLSTHYQAGMINEAFNLRLDRFAFRLDGFRVEGKKDATAVLSFGRIDVNGGRFDLRSRRIAFNSIVLSGGGISAVRDAKGKINLLNLLPASNKQAAEPKAAGAGGWRYRIGHVALSGFGLDVRDQSVVPAARLGLEDISAETGDVTEDMTRPLQVRTAFRSRDGGNFSAEGTVVPATPSADLQIKLDGLALAPAQPYLGSLTTLKLVGGSLSSEGHAVYDGKDGEYTGSVAVRDLRIVEAGGKQTFLAWKSLTTTTLAVSKTHLNVRELLLDGLDTRLIIAKDRSINFTKILRQPKTAAAAARPSAAALYPVRVGRLRIGGSQLEFADQSLALPFGTHIHALTGTMVNISSKQGAPARLLIDGQIDDYGMAHAEGRIDLFKPTDNLDVTVDFKNVEMTRLTPYSATFAGRKIDSGKLTLHLEYKIQNRQLAGNNQIIMDQLTLGERVQSPQAKDLPLDIAIAILEDSNGRIDLGLPVSGSLDDPKFSYSGIIWKAIVNVLTKVVTAPFRALGALFDSDDQIDGIVFNAGSPTLTPPEREKAVAFAAALNKRPRLSVVVHGTWSEVDRAALKDLQLRKAIAGKLGLSSEGDPGLLTPDQPKVKQALEDLYAGRFGNGGLAAIREAFGKANPGKLQTSTSGRIMSVFTGIIGSKPTLSDSDVTQMKGADFHTMLYQKLLAAEDVPDAALQQLAQARGTAVMTELRNAQAPADRVKLDAAEKTDAQNNDVPLKMDMEALAKPQAATDAGKK
jgi:hypothetical protein